MSLQKVRDDWTRHEHTLVSHVRQLAEGKRWMRFVGGMRVGVEILSANMFHVIAVVLLAILVSNPQVRDVADAALDTRHEAAVKMWVPVAIFSLLLYVSACVAGMTARPIIREICLIRFLDQRVAMQFLGNVFPFLLLIVAPICLYLIVPQAFNNFIVAGILLVTIGLPALASFAILLMDRARVPHIMRSLTINAVLLALLLLFGIAVTDVNYSRNLGPLGILLISVALWAAVLNAFYVAMTKWLRVPAIFFLLLAAILVFVAQQPERTIVPYKLTLTKEVTQYGYANRSQHNVKAHFRRWLLSTVSSDPTSPIPIFLVAAEGGGIRSGYWTARTLALLNAQTGGNFSRFTFAYSGVSGGSLGIITYLDAARLHRDNPASAIEVLDAFYSQDFLSPVLGKLLFTEPWHLLTGGLFGRSRRDTTFEESISSDWKRLAGSNVFDSEFESAVGQIANDAPWTAPAVLLNASIMESGKQVVMSNVTPDVPQSKTDYLFSLNMPFAKPRLSLAEAVHLSARFPIISPPARVAVPAYKAGTGPDNRPLPGCNELLPTPRCGKWENRHWGTVVDGGYVDNSGLDSLEDVYDALVQERNRAAMEESQHETDPEERRYLAVLKRISIHVLVIKNATDYKKPGIPRLREAPSHDEFYVMVNTMLQARTARAEIAAARVASRIRIEEESAAQQCWRGDELQGKLLPPIEKAKAANPIRVCDAIHAVDLGTSLSML
jgi:hypothetical protein